MLQSGYSLYYPPPLPVNSNRFNIRLESLKPVFTLFQDFSGVTHNPLFYRERSFFVDLSFVGFDIGLSEIGDPDLMSVVLEIECLLNN